MKGVKLESESVCGRHSPNDIRARNILDGEHFSDRIRVHISALKGKHLEHFIRADYKVLKENLALLNRNFFDLKRHQHFLALQKVHSQVI